MTWEPGEPLFLSPDEACIGITLPMFALLTTHWDDDCGICVGEADATPGIVWPELFQAVS